MLKLYDFKCHDCNEEYEQLIDPDKQVLTVCPKCNSVNTHRTWTKSNFRVYGEGAYNNKLVF